LVTPAVRINGVASLAVTVPRLVKVVAFPTLPIEPEPTMVCGVSLVSVAWLMPVRIKLFALLLMTSVPVPVIVVPGPLK
jgi:hypothetical protein